MRRPSEVNGFVRVHVKGSEKAFQVCFSDFGPLMEAWEGGRPFYRGTDSYGDPLNLKLGEVIAVALASPAGIERYDAEEAEFKFKESE